MKTILTLIMVFGFLSMTSAQQGKKQQELKRFRPMAMESFRSVNPNIEQITQYKQLKQDFRKKRRAIRNDQSLSKEEKKAAMKKINRDRSQRYWKEILTPEQAKQLRAKRSQNKKTLAKQKQS